MDTEKGLTMFKNNTSTISDSLSSVDDTIYSYSDCNTMNTLTYPSTAINPSPPHIYITNNTGTISPNWNLLNDINDTLTIGKLSVVPLKVNGDAEIEGKLKLGGKDIGDILDRLEERLAILHPNTELEDRWEELKELGKRYKELEKDILEKEKIYNILKK